MACSLRLRILSALLLLPFREPLTYGKKLKMLKALTFGGLGALASNATDGHGPTLHAIEQVFFLGLELFGAQNSSVPKLG